MQKKKGISLIVLVITIIVMIILAASVIISLTSSNIVDKAGTAVDLTDEKQVQNLASITWAEAFIEKMEGNTVDLDARVKQALTNAGVTLTDYNINVSDTGVVVNRKPDIVKLATPTVVDAAGHHEITITYDGPATKFNVYYNGSYSESITKTGTSTTAKVQTLVSLFPYNCGADSVEITASADGLTGYEESEKVSVVVTFCDD